MRARACVCLPVCVRVCVCAHAVAAAIGMWAVHCLLPFGTRPPPPKTTAPGVPTHHPWIGSVKSRRLHLQQENVVDCNKERVQLPARLSALPRLRCLMHRHVQQAGKGRAGLLPAGHLQPALQACMQHVHKQACIRRNAFQATKPHSSRCFASVHGSNENSLLATQVSAVLKSNN